MLSFGHSQLKAQTSAAVSAPLVQNAILGRIPTNAIYDLNHDGRLDVADLVVAARLQPIIASFPVPTTVIVTGSNVVSVPVNFTGPYTGPLSYQISGTAIPKSTGITGDYVQPSGSIFVTNATSATIKIQMVPEPDIEINREIVIAISSPPLTNQTYVITTNSSVATIQIVQSSQGVFLGNLTITNGLLSGVQSVKMALRAGLGNNTIALFDVTGNSLLGNTFSVPASVNADSFQLGGGQPFTQVVSNTPWGRPLTVQLTFGTTQNTNGIALITPVTLSILNLTASGVTYSGSGILTLVQSQ